MAANESVEPDRVAVRWRRLDDGNLEGYIRRALVRTNISWWRSRRREDLVEQVPEDSADDVGERTDRRLVLARALARLTARQRAVVVLRYYEDRTEAQVADLLNISIGTVKSQTHAALARLRTAAPELAEFKEGPP